MMTKSFPNRDYLLDNGIYVVGFSYPVVPKGLGLQISSAHTKNQIEKAVNLFEEAGKKFGILK